MSISVTHATLNALMLPSAMDVWHVERFLNKLS